MCETVCKETTNRQSEIIAAAEELYDNRLGWSKGRNPYAPTEFWIRLGKALGRDVSPEVFGKRPPFVVDMPDKLVPPA